MCVSMQPLRLPTSFQNLIRGMYRRPCLGTGWSRTTHIITISPFCSVVGKDIKPLLQGYVSNASEDADVRFYSKEALALC
jgi:hypothetical protein